MSDLLTARQRLTGSIRFPMRAALNVQVEALDRGRADQAKIAEEVFELSHTLRQRWVTAGVRAKRRLLEIVCLNFTMNGASLGVETRKPFDVLAEGLFVPYSRGHRTPVNLFADATNDMSQLCRK